MENRAKSWLPRLALPSILALTAALRFVGLTFQSLRNDEHFSRDAAALESVGDVIVRGGILDKHPPGHVLLLHYWIRLFGESEWSVRVPSVLAGIAAVYALYRFGRAVASERVGLIAGGLAAVSQMPVYFSQDARAYVFLLLGSTLCAHGVLALERAREAKRPSRWLRLGLLLAATFTAYLHYFGLLFVALLGLYALLSLVRRRLSFADWAIPFLGSAVLYVPWLATVFVHATKRSSWMPEPNERFLEILTEHLTSKQPNVWVAIFCVAAAIHVFDGLRTWRTAPSRGHLAKLVSPVVLTLLAWIVCSFAGAFAVTYSIIPVISARNLIIILPALYLLGAIALSKIDVRVFRGVPVVATLAIVGLLYHLVFAERYYSARTKRQYRAVAAFLAKQAELQAEPIFIATEGNWDTWLNYYWEGRNGDPIARSANGTPLRAAATTRTLYAQLSRQKPESIWAVINSTGEMSRLPTWFSGYRSAKTKRFVGIRLRRFDQVERREDEDATEEETEFDENEL